MKPFPVCTIPALTPADDPVLGLAGQLKAIEEGVKSTEGATIHLVRSVLSLSFAGVAALFVLLLVVPTLRAGEVEKVLLSFPLDGSTGANPNSGVIADAKGDLYGTTHDGGKYNFGVLFKLHRGREKVLHTFGGRDDFGYPLGRLVLDAAGNVYGGTQGGMVYKVSPKGRETVLHAFSGGSDGGFIVHGLVADAEGNLYGTTEDGGGSSRCENGCGTIFKVTPDGQETLLYNFDGHGDGWNPRARVTMDALGNLYGTTFAGGAYNRGSVFKLTPEGEFSTLYSFGGSGHPFTPVTLDEAGNLYGTTLDYFGEIYKLTPDGTYTVVYDFEGGSGGQGPQELIRDEAGNLYGVCGYPDQVFKVTPDGTKTELYVFSGGDDGSTPVGPLYRDVRGNLYGTTYYQGGGAGCVFEVVNQGN